MKVNVVITKCISLACFLKSKITINNTVNTLFFLSITCLTIAIIANIFTGISTFRPLILLLLSGIVLGIVKVLQTLSLILNILLQLLRILRNLFELKHYQDKHEEEVDK